jgi:branched-chain amino acid transport system substrate-binding protein
MKKIMVASSIFILLLLLLASPGFADPIKKHIEVTYNNIQLFIDGTKITPKDVNGKIVEPFIHNGTTYLPVRAVGEALGKTVDWDGATQTVYIGDMPVTATVSDDIIRIGVFQPLTGAFATGGELELLGVELAHELYPEVLGKKVVLVVGDNKSNKAESANVAQRLIERDKVVALLGSYSSSLTIPAGDVVKEAKIPAVAISSTNVLVTKGNDYYFRACFIDPFQGIVMARYAYNEVGARTAAIVQEVSNDYAVGLSNFFQEEFRKLTGNPDSIVYVGNYNNGDKDFSAFLTNIKGLNPDVIFAPGNFTESALAIKQARQLGLTMDILGGDTYENDDFLEVGGNELEGVVFSTFFDRAMVSSDEGKKFLAEFDKRYPGYGSSAATALGYEAYLMVINAIEKAGTTDSQAIRDQLAATKDLMGVTSSITLDENGDAIRDAVIKVVKNGKFEYLMTIKAQ